MNPAFPDKLVTLGDFLRQKRLERGLSQQEVAKTLQASDVSVTGWELNRNAPTAKYAKRIIEFLGELPFSIEGLPFYKQVQYARLTSGLTQAQVAKKIGCDSSNLRLIEKGIRRPNKRLREKLEGFVEISLNSE